MKTAEAARFGAAPKGARHSLLGVYPGLTSWAKFVSPFGLFLVRYEVLRARRGAPLFSCRIKLALSYLAWIHLSSETSRSSPILIMGRARWPTACSSLPAR